MAIIHVIAWTLLATTTPDAAGATGPKPRNETGKESISVGDAEDARLRSVLDAMQKTYEGTKDFTARFTQKYTSALLRKTQESSGEVRFLKPGLMRWDYSHPVSKSFIVDGKSLWIVQPTDNTAFVNSCFKQDGLTTSVAFLWGTGNLREQFHARWFQGTFGDASDFHIELAPKTPNPAFAKLILVLDPKTHRVRQSIVVDPQGNVNQFIYAELRFNVGLSSSSFRYSPPTNMQVQKMPGSC